jgi:hypothetical protein
MPTGPAGFHSAGPFPLGRKLLTEHVIMLPTASGALSLEETTLDEPVMDTLKREFKMIANKMYKVFECFNYCFYIVLTFL